MMLLWLPVGLLLPTLSGWLLMRLLEGRSPVLLRLERWTLAFVLGLTLTMECTFLLHISHVLAFTRLGFLSTQLLLTAILLILFLIQRRHSPPHLPTPYARRPTPFWLALVIILASLWLLFKFFAGSTILVTTPPYFDDTLKNWNLRGKVFFLSHELNLSMEIPKTTEINPLSSYPPTVPMVKAWLASLAGQWDEGLVNSIHPLWFLAALFLLGAALRRRLPFPWAFLGIYLLASLPLYFLHGVNAYADVFLSVHLFAAVSLLFCGVAEADTGRRATFLRLSALATALLVFTKNEALVLHLPLLIALLLGSLVILVRSGHMQKREAGNALLWFVGWGVALALPWFLFKWSHGLTFGNAKSLSAGALGWQPGVPTALWVNTFLEGNWLLLFPLFCLLIIVLWRRAFTGPLALLSLFLIASLLLQISLFLFTSLAPEAINQTGFARGVLQLAPLIVFTMVILIQTVFTRERG